MNSNIYTVLKILFGKNYQMQMLTIFSETNLTKKLE